MSKISVDDARVVYPLFQAEYGGSSPTSALQLRVARIGTAKAVELNRLWHSRLPTIGTASTCTCFAASFNNVFYAVAMWSNPIAMLLNGRGWYELRRMAVSSDAPKNTPSRFLSIMVRLIHQNNPNLVKLISYQDTAVHAGTIYKASGWKIGHTSEPGDSHWNNRGFLQSESVKVRWELDFP